MRNPVAQKLSTKRGLLGKVQNVLPTGTDLNLATAGFRNFGQFVAAVNASNNLGINFADLKLAMTGTPLTPTPTGTTATTGTTTAVVQTMSLGQAIQKLKPGADGMTEAQRAYLQADAQIESTPTTSTSTATATSTSTTTSMSAKQGKPSKTGKSG